MVKMVIWGTGVRAKNNYALLSKMKCFEDIEVIGYVDSNSEKWGTEFNGKKVIGPEKLLNIEFDYIDIWVASARREIVSQIEQLNIPKEKIRDAFLLYKEELVTKYENPDEEQKDILRQICKNPGITVYNYEPSKKSEYYKVCKDIEHNFNYIMFEGKRMYLSKKFDGYIWRDKECYVSDIWQEQDLNSPHRYEDGQVSVLEGDVLVDAGVCEGNFALHHIDKVKKVYLIECDEDWIEALRLTFEPYKEKVVFCNKFLSSFDSADSIRLDSLISEPIDFLKMDIEGEEINALLGGERLLLQSENARCAICTYHKHGDEEKIREILNR